MRSIKFILPVLIIFTGITGCGTITNRETQYAETVDGVGEPEKLAVESKMGTEPQAKRAMEAIKGLLESAGSARQAIYTAYSWRVPYEQVSPACNLYEEGIVSINSILASLDKKNYSQVQKEAALAMAKLSEAKGIAQTVTQNLKSQPVIDIREDVNHTKAKARKTQEIVLRTYEGLEDQALFRSIFDADSKLLAALAALNEEDFSAVQYNLRDAKRFYARAMESAEQVEKLLAMEQAPPPQLLPIQHIDHTGTEPKHKLPHPKSTTKSTLPQIIVDDSEMQGSHHDHSQMQHMAMMKTPIAEGSLRKMSQKINGLTFHLKTKPERLVSGREAEYRLKIESADQFTNLHAKFDMPMMRGMHVFNPIPKYDNAVGDYTIKHALPMSGVWELEISVLTNQGEKRVAFEINVFGE